MGVKVKHKSTKALHKKAWDLQSIYIRRSAKGICFTCGTHKHWKDTDAGHYIHKKSMDFVLMNINCQCNRCNRFLHGNLGVYAERLIAEYGEDALMRLRRIEAERDKKPYKLTIQEYEDLIEYYTIRIKDLDERRIK